MAIKLYIAGADRTDYLKLNTGRVSGDINRRWTFSGQLEEQRRGYRPARGAVLKLSDGESPETVWFEGHIRRIVERHHPGTTALQYDIEAGDYNWICARRTVTAEYQGQTLYAIVSHINTNFLSGEGITLAGVANPGPTINEKLTFRYESAASVFNRLSTITGYLWAVGFDRDLAFDQFASTPAPISLTDTSENWRNLEVEVSDEDYRNRQHERTEVTVASTAGSFSSAYPTEDPITALAGQTSFPTAGQVMEMRRITVDDVDKTFIGVDPTESTPASGYDFYYFIGGIGFFALDWGPAAGGEIVRYDYYGDWSPYAAANTAINGGDASAGVRVITVNDADEQTARAAAEGGSGIWEAVEEQRNISSADTLRAIGEGRLRQYGAEARRLRFETDEAGLLPGQRIDIDIDLHSIDAEYLIERVDFDWVAARTDFLRTRCTCTSLEPFGKSIGFIEKLVETARIGPGGGGGGSSAVTPGGSGGGSVAVIRERPKGVVDGSNATFDLTYEPDPPQSLRLTINGVLADPITDYSLSGARITYNAGCMPANSTDEHLAWYFHAGVTPANLSARKFAGGTDLVNWGYDNAFRIAGDVSWGMWLKLSSSATGWIMSCGATNGVETGHEHCYQLVVKGSSGAWDIEYWHDYSGSANDRHQFNTNIPNDTWKWISFSRDAVLKTVSLYIGNGASVSLIETWSYTNDPVAGTNPASRLVVGGTWSDTAKAGDATYAFSGGSVEEHYLWNRTLTLAEHQAAMMGQFSRTGLLLASMMGASPEGDISGNGHSGAVTGTTLIAGH